MDLKFYLNKLLKIDNIEYYSLNSLVKLKKCYDKFLDSSEGIDPDYPMLNFRGKKKGKSINMPKKNKMLFDEDDNTEAGNNTTSSILNL